MPDINTTWETQNSDYFCQWIKSSSEFNLIFSTVDKNINMKQVINSFACHLRNSLMIANKRT